MATLQRYMPQQTRVAVAGPVDCELCSEPIALEHRHLLEVATSKITCVCRACAILFDAEAASSGKYRLIPDRRLYLEDFHIDAAQWQSMQIPVGLAFFCYHTPTQRVVALYPGPMGATEALLDRRTWEELQERHAVLRTLQPDVEALLVNHARGARQYFVAPIDECYRLVSVIRQHWRGLGGGQEVWKEIIRFFETLQQRARTVRRQDVSAVPAE